MVKNSANVHANNIIKVMRSSYRGANFICITCNPVTVIRNGTFGYNQKYIWIQQSKNALNQNAVVKVLQTAFPTLIFQKISKDADAGPETRLSDWGTFNKSHVHKISPTTAVTAEQIDHDMFKLKQELADLKSSDGEKSQMAITPYGFENLSHISPQEYAECITESVPEGLLRLTVETIEKIHSADENRNFFMKPPHDTDVWVHQKGGEYVQIPLEQFAKDAPLHYADIVKAACRPMRKTVIGMTKEWVADHNKKRKHNMIMRTLQTVALGNRPVNHV